MSEPATSTAEQRTRLVFNCGLDEQSTDPHLMVEERGMRFLSQWEFSLGTQLSVLCDYDQPRFGRKQVRLEGIVVWSERHSRPVDQAPLFDTTLLFLELPD